MNILITGCAGFIGFHASKKFLAEGYTVIGIDNLNKYYDVQLKKDRLENLKSPNFKFYRLDLNKGNLKKFLKTTTLTMWLI